ncbi:MAG: hypothetical protein MHM6MM_000214 [Cercozoa sp. M6MM]
MEHLTAWLETAQQKLQNCECDYVQLAQYAAGVALAGVFVYVCVRGGKQPVKQPQQQQETQQEGEKKVPDRVFTAEELTPFNGTEGEDIYVALDGLVYNMSSHETGPAFYGPEGAYHAFAGKDATVALATMELERAGESPAGVALNAQQQQTLADWVKTMQNKYDIVGRFEDKKSQ